jgi:glycosyltransferase involved in cell wall biosynthesis
VLIVNSGLVVAVVGVEFPDAGGAHTAETLMLGQIKKSLNENEIIVIEPRKKYAHPREDFKRLGGFFRSLYLLWKSNPVIWSLTRRFDWIPPSKFERDLLRMKVDLVFFVGLYDRALELKRIPYIATIWDLGHRDLPVLPEFTLNREFERREWRIKNIAMKAIAIIVDSEITKVKLKTYYGIEDSKIHSLPFAPNVGKELLQDERESFALYPAHYWSHKNHIVLFNAIAQLLSENKKSRILKLTGQDRGNLNYLIEKTNELGISKYVEFLGFIPQSELRTLYQRAAIVVMPSLLGPTNLPPLESLLRGCSVAVTPNARANLGNWSGVIELNGDDIRGWSKLLDVSSSFPHVDVPMIQKHLAETEVSNVMKLKSLFMSFKSMKDTHC